MELWVVDVKLNALVSCNRNARSLTTNPTVHAPLYCLLDGDIPSTQSLANEAGSGEGKACT